LLVLFALIPSLIWYLSVYYLASPVGNMDTGATWGSFIGLFFLACIYAAAGLFASAITENQIIAFLLGLIISFFLYTGFESIASLPFLSNVENFIIYLGINEHYQSISRGVIDTRDIFYFSGLAALFLFSTQLYLQSRKW
ncbi:MAG: gliding motility-associated ABC transporter permease subunit GldF, partial [Bacteroidales bacterium]